MFHVIHYLNINAFIYISFEDGGKFYEGLQKYFYFYNNERIHQSLECKTPASQYRFVA